MKLVHGDQSFAWMSVLNWSKFCLFINKCWLKISSIFGTTRQINLCEERISASLDIVTLKERCYFKIHDTYSAPFQIKGSHHFELTVYFYAFRTMFPSTGEAKLGTKYLELHSDII